MLVGPWTSNDFNDRLTLPSYFCLRVYITLKPSCWNETMYSVMAGPVLLGLFDSRLAILLDNC